MKVSDAEMIAAGNELYTAVQHWREYQTHGTCDEKGWARVADAMRNYHEKRMGENCGKMAKGALAAPAGVYEAAFEIRSVQNGTTTRFHVINVDSTYHVDPGGDRTILAINEKEIRRAILDTIQNGISCCSNGEGGEK